MASVEVLCSRGIAVLITSVQAHQALSDLDRIHANLKAVLQPASALNHPPVSSRYRTRWPIGTAPHSHMLHQP
jgi:hypothetical protein